MDPIVSADDPRIADYRLLTDPAAASRAGLFVAEGRFVVRRLLSQSRLATRSVLATSAGYAAIVDTVPPAVPCFVAEQTVMNAIAGFDVHRGCVALGERPPATPVQALPWHTIRRLVVLEGVNNPDNVGGIFRSAAAFGVDAIVLSPGCADPFYRKAIRTSMAATLQLPFAQAEAWPDAVSDLSARGFTVVALTTDDDAQRIDDTPRRVDRVALLLGSEGEGLTPGAVAAATTRVRIPMRGAIDSLNVNVAAGIALHHFRG